MQQAINAAVNRLIAFEMQLGPFAVAQWRILAEIVDLTGSAPSTPTRMFVTDTLGNPEDDEGWIPGILATIAQSRKDANKIKRDEPITVMLGNPPYKEKAKGRGGWVEGETAEQELTAPLAEWKPPREWGAGAHSKHLRNLYVYFWRWATWKAFDHGPGSKTGIVCFISVAGFLSGPGFQKMRDYLRRTCDPGKYYKLMGLPAFLLKSGFKGQAFSPAYQAGYCLYNGYRPMVDTRWEVYDPRQLADFHAAVRDPVRWWETVVKYNIRGILLTHFPLETDVLLPRMPRDPRWRLVWYDSSASFWVRFDQLPAVATLRPDSDVDQRPLPPRLEECLWLARFYEMTGVYRRARACYERALELGGEKAPISKALEWVQLRLAESERK